MAGKKKVTRLGETSGNSNNLWWAELIETFPIPWCGWLMLSSPVMI